MGKITYKSSGVDIDKANLLVKDYKKFASFTKIKGVISDVGSFGALFRPDFKKFKDPLLVSSTDGVGTKLKIAFLADKHNTVGIDLVAMSANDILCSGAEGLFFLDYISTGKVEPKVLRAVVKGIDLEPRLLANRNQDHIGLANIHPRFHFVEVRQRHNLGALHHHGADDALAHLVVEHADCAVHRRIDRGLFQLVAELVQALVLDGPDESLRARVQVRRLLGHLQAAHAGGLQGLLEPLREQRVRFSSLR